MLEHPDAFLGRLEQDLPPIEWADSDIIRGRGGAHRRRRRQLQLVGALIVVLALAVVGATTRADHVTPAPIRHLEGMQLSPDLCGKPRLIKYMHLQDHPCSRRSDPGRYLDATHGMNAASPFALTLPVGWSFQPLKTYGIGSQVDLTADDGSLGIRLAVYVRPAMGKHHFMGTRAELLDSLRAVPGLTVSPETKVRIGGQPAVQVDITSGPNLPPAKADCLIAVPCFALFQQSPIVRPVPPVYTVGAIPGTTSRLIFPSAHAYGAIPPTLIWIWDTNPTSNFQADLQRSQPIVDSLDFFPPEVPTRPNG